MEYFIYRVADASLILVALHWSINSLVIHNVETLLLWKNLSNSRKTHSVCNEIYPRDFFMAMNFSKKGA